MMKQLTVLLAFLMTFSGPVAAVSNQEAWVDFVSQNVWGSSDDYWLYRYEG